MNFSLEHGLQFSQKEEKIISLTIGNLLVWHFVIGMSLQPRIIRIENTANIVSANIGALVPAEAHAADTRGDENTIDTSGSSSYTSPVEAEIRKVFGDHAEEALKVAQCESQMQPQKIGDKHLTFWHQGELLGASYGVFQIRSGGNENGVWSRPAKLGLTLNEFETLMLDPTENIRYAKQIFDRGGWGPWTCKKVLNK